MSFAKMLLIVAIVVAVVAAILSSMPLPNAPGAQACTKDQDCSTGGCSNQVCTTAAAAPHIITTCEWRAEYDCLRLTSCSCITGACAWRNTTEYQTCLRNVSG